MELMPTLELGWLNGWILLGVENLIQGFLLLIFPRDVVARLFDRSGWNVKQRAFLIAGKVFSLACLVLIIFTPLMLVMSRLLQHFSILAEEEVCLQRYGESYREFMGRVPRYFLFF